MGALRFFYGTTLGRKRVADQIPYARRADTLPAVLSRDEVERFLKAVSNLKMRTAFITIYAAGLRVSELVALTSRTSTARAWSSTSGRQGRQGSLRDAVRAIARHPARLLETHQAAPLAFPRAPVRQPITTRESATGLPRGGRGGAVSTSRSPCIRCGTASPRICWSRGSISASFRTCSAIATSASTTRYTRVAVNTIRQIQSPLEHLNIEKAPPA